MPTPVSANFFTASGEWQTVTVNLLSKEEFYAKISKENHNSYANSEDRVTISNEAFAAFNTEKELWFMEDTSKIANATDRLAREEELKEVDNLYKSVTETEKTFNVVAEKTFDSGTKISIASDVVEQEQKVLTEEDYIFSSIMYNYGDNEDYFYNDEAYRSDMKFVLQSQTNEDLSGYLGYNWSNGAGAHMMVQREHLSAEYIDKFNNRNEAFAQPTVNATITYADGRIETVSVTENTKFSEDKDGNIIISSGDDALQATDTDDFLVAFSEMQTASNNVKADVINTGDGDDTLVLIGDGLLNQYITKYTNQEKYTGQKEDKDRAKIHLGDGNKEIIGINQYSADITGGDGNHTISGIQGSVSLGDGDNTLSNLMGTVTLGDGDNTVNNEIDKKLAGTIPVLDVTVGNGENDIAIANGNVAVGDGNNNIHVENESYNISAGNGNNNIDIHNARRAIDIGNGNNNIDIQTFNGIATFVAGDGNNNINIHTYASGGFTEHQNSEGEWVYGEGGLRTGYGNNQINIERYKLGSGILLNSGNNTLNIGSMYSEDREGIFSNSRISSLSYLLTSAGTMIFIEGDNNKVTMYGKELSNHHFDLGKRDRRASEEEIQKWYY